MYKALMYFIDLQDDKYAYHTGDIFPREGMKVSPERLAELSSDKNRRGIPVIEKIEEELPVEEAEAPKVEETPTEEPKPRKRARKKG